MSSNKVTDIIYEHKYKEKSYCLELKWTQVLAMHKIDPEKFELACIQTQIHKHIWTQIQTQMQTHMNTNISKYKELNRCLPSTTLTRRRSRSLRLTGERTWIKSRHTWRRWVFKYFQCKEGDIQVLSTWNGDTKVFWTTEQISSWRERRQFLEFSLEEAALVGETKLLLLTSWKSSLTTISSSQVGHLLTFQTTISCKSHFTSFKISSKSYRFSRVDMWYVFNLLSPPVQEWKAGDNVEGGRRTEAGLNLLPTQKTPVFSYSVRVRKLVHLTCLHNNKICMFSANGMAVVCGTALKNVMFHILYISIHSCSTEITPYGY